ncbi:Csu type fimbrial protein [Luteimonas terrae]|nr:spore coat U domain-containing protein [Luteimonas terrae]
MSVSRICTCAMLLVAGVFATSAVAQSTSTTFQVRMSVESVCAFTAPGATDVDFGDQPSTALGIDAEGALSVTCTLGTPYNVTLNAGQNSGAGGVADRNMTNGTALLPYQLYRDPGRSEVWGNTVPTDTVTGTGTGAVQTIPVYGRVPSANFPAGSYLDVVTATVVY